MQDFSVTPTAVHADADAVADVASALRSDLTSEAAVAATGFPLDDLIAQVDEGWCRQVDTWVGELAGLADRIHEAASAFQRTESNAEVAADNITAFLGE